MTFIHPENVTDAFVNHSVHLGDPFQVILYYFEDNRIGHFRANGSRARPLFSIDYWNAYERTKNLQMRTDNVADVWNKCIRKYVNKK